MSFHIHKWQLTLALFVLCAPLYAQVAETAPLLDRIDSLNKKGIELRYKNPDSARVYGLEALELAETINASEKIGDSYRTLGLAERYSGNYSVALDYQTRALDIFTELGDSSKIASAYINIGNIHKRQGRFTEALECQIHGLHILEALGSSSRKLAVSYNNIGNLYRTMDDFENALQFHETALSLRQEAADTSNIAVSLANIGLIYYDMKDYDTAIAYYERALPLLEALGEVKEVAKTHGKIANVFYKQGQLERSEAYHLLALEGLAISGDPYSISVEQRNLGLVYEDLGRESEAIDHYQLALETAEAASATVLEADAWEDLSRMYRQTGNYQLAYEALARHKLLNDSLLSETTASRMAELRTELETEQKEKEIIALQEREQIQQRQRTYLAAGLILFALLALLAGIGWWARIRANAVLKKQRSDMHELLAEKEQLLNQLSQANNQLIATEKMASLGQLTAGVAHEINNPVNFITSSVEALKLDFADLKELLERLSEVADSQNAEQLAGVLTLFRKIDGKFLTREMEELIQSIERGTQRTQEIVKNLRTFSRDTSEEFLKADLHEGLDSAVAILRHKMADRIQLERKYSKLPQISCQISRLNQVFLNILDNAIQAIPKEGVITLATAQQNGSVQVSITDTGSGMDPVTRKRIFEPFFSTKEIGQGTGLGLSISYGIIEQHGGTIAVKSEPGSGSEFIITLPIDQTADSTT